MNPIQESISNSISALPAASLMAPPAAGQRGAGFASTLAAAQGLSTQSLGSSEAPSTQPVLEGSAAGSTAVSSLSARAIFNVNLQPRKPLSAAGSSTTGSAIANNVAPGPVLLTASPMAWPGSQTGPLPSLIEATSLKDGGVAGQSVPALPGLATEGPRLNQAASFLATGSVGESVGSVAKPALSDVLVGNAQPPVVVQAPAQSNLAAISSSSSAAPGSQPNNSKNELGPIKPTAVAGNTQPSELSFTSTSTSTSNSTSASELPLADTVWNANSNLSGNGTPADGFPVGTTQYAAQRFQSGAEPTGAPVLLASALPEADPLAGTQSSLNANLQTAQDQVAQEQVAQEQVTQNQVAQVQATQDNDSQAVATRSAPQSNVPLPAEIGSLLSAMAGAPAAAPSVLNSNFQVPTLSQTTLRPGAPRVTAPALASVRGPSASSVPTSAVATGSGAGNGSPGNGSPLASQSPFSVFFSSPSSSPSSSLGPGTEAAAAALPKMILPAANSAGHAGIAANSVGAAANSQTSGLQSNAVQPTAPPTIASQTTASQTTKDSLSATASGSSQAGQPLHAEPTAAAPSVAIAQAATVAPGAAVTSAPVAVVAAAQAATAPLPQPSLPPGAGAASPATLVPAAPQALPTAAPGPVQMAQMVDRMGQSEMRVGMNTSAFGNVEVRTVVHASDVGLTIGSEKGDLRGLLANDMPAITNNLQQQNLRLSSVSFSQGFSFSNQSSGGGDAQQRSFVPTPAAASYGSPEALPADSSEVVPIGEFGGAGNSLSILA